MAQPPTNLAIARRRAQMSQTELALKADVSREPIVWIETRRTGRQLRAKTLQKIAKAVGMPLEELLADVNG